MPIWRNLKNNLMFCVMIFSTMLLDCQKPTDTSDSGMSFTPVISNPTDVILSFLQPSHGSVNAKMVFIILNKAENSKKLCYIDFSELVTTPVVHVIKAAKDAQLPVISPDGNWVVYASGQGCEAGSPVAKRSSVYICRIAEDAKPVIIARDSACEPRFMQNVTPITVIYPTLAPNCAWEGYGRTMQVAVDVSSGTPVVGTPQVLIAHGSYTGGLSWDNKYICGGGLEIAMFDLSSGKTRPDTVSLFGQSCNASISSSRIFTNTMSHLTTTGSHPLIDDGKEWQTWQVIIINDNAAHGLARGYRCPATAPDIETNPPSLSSLKWHHSEWSNHPYYAVATMNAVRSYKAERGWVHSEYQERIYMINLKDSTYLEVLHPDTVFYNGVDFDNSGFHWPGLWVEVPASFSEEANWLYNKD